MSVQKRNLNKEIIAQFSGQQAIFSIPKVYFRLTKCLNKAYFLNQMVFHSDKSTYFKDGWFYKTYAEWQQELDVCERTLRTYFKEFEKENWIEMRIAKVKGVRTPIFRPKMENITAAIEAMIEKEVALKEANINQVEQQSTQTAEIAELDKNVPKRQILPDSQTANIAVSNTIDTYDSKHIKTTTAENQSSSGFFTSKQKKDLIALKPLCDNREDEIFLSHCQAHIEKQDNKHTFFQRIAGLRKILKGLLETNEVFKAKGMNHLVSLSQPKETIQERNARYKREKDEQDKRIYG